MKTITNNCFQALQGLKFQALEGLKFQDKQTQKQMIQAFKEAFYFFLFRIFFFVSSSVDIFTNNVALAMFDPLVELGVKPNSTTR